MKTVKSFVLYLFCSILFLSCNHSHEGIGLLRQENFNNGWRFFRGDPEDAGALVYDDSSWRLIDLPHDYSIEDLAYSPGKN